MIIYENTIFLIPSSGSSLINFPLGKGKKNNDETQRNALAQNENSLTHLYMWHKRSNVVSVKYNKQKKY